MRIVVADVETSGLDPWRDRLLSIGAVALEHGTVRFSDSFQILVRQEHASAPQNILVHGIGGTAQMNGAEAGDALAAWCRFAGTAPLVGFHADFDRIVIDRATRAALGTPPDHQWLDLAFLAPALFSQEAATLDDWMRVFGIEAYARHDALADALATAQLLQVVLAEGARRGMRTLDDYSALERDRRWLVQSLRR